MKKVNKPPLTFAELYRKRLQGVRASISDGSTILVAKETISLSKCDQLLNDFAASLEKDRGSSLSKIKFLLNGLPKQFNEYIMKWLDKRDMDLLHLCIVFDRPEIIRLILESPNMFPDGYSPNFNPYAHLAASLGHSECLEAVLSRRPSFYFRSSQPRHAVRLHKDIQARLKIKEGGSSINKHVQKMLKKINESSINAEKSWELLGKKMLSETDILDQEVEDLSKRKSSLTKRVSNRKARSSISFDLRESDKQKRLQLLPSTTTSLSNMNGNDVSCQRTERKKKHVITVYRDDLLGEEQGIVKGAGPAVNVVHAEDLQSESPRLPTIEDIRTLNQRSSVIMARRGRLGVSEHFKLPPKENVKSMSRFDMSGNRADTSNNSVEGMSSHKISSLSLFRRIEMGIRKVKKYKDFQVVIDSRLLTFKDEKSYMNKTPLTIAAEKGHINCVKYILQTFVLKQNPVLTPDQPLTLATKARSPESIAILLAGKQCRDDFQSAILTALRDFLPACLTVLLSERKDRAQLFDGENLLHIFYGQSLNSDYRHEMMLEMTRTLISCKEDVNARGPASSHPMYTLIRCAFNIKGGKQFYNYLDCLRILLSARANPHYNEIKDGKSSCKPRLALSRPPYFSALHCIFTSADQSTNFLENPLWSKIIMQKFIDCIVVNDKTPRKILNDVLFTYIERVGHLGLDRKILRSLLRYGANPDFKHEDKYAINHFFDLMLPFLTRFEVISKIDSFIDALMMLCRSMTQQILQEAFSIFLREHFLQTPLQALPLTRRFCYEVNLELRHPRSLMRLTGLVIWKQIRRNCVIARKLPVRSEVLGLILP